MFLFADCTAVGPLCQYQLGGTVSYVKGPLPCINGRTWKFVAGDMPTENGQVACSVPSDATAILSFSATTRTCSTSGQSVAMTVNALGNTCRQTLAMGAYPGEWAWALLPQAGQSSCVFALFD
jgi:hypothetical protein